ncbi:hypothetical protein H920_15293 [Fukomys damarensis]|uniref:Uncharacterized protein n=1 Tax=Fukomys damarensis TaxID=885580 RepID=A0A091CXE9_FUKDA|nr:hypothetical protein H920_15293 [Fukomys damarensis]
MGCRLAHQDEKALSAISQQASGSLLFGSPPGPLLSPLPLRKVRVLQAIFKPDFKIAQGELRGCGTSSRFSLEAALCDDWQGNGGSRAHSEEVCLFRWSLEQAHPPVSVQEGSWKLVKNANLDLSPGHPGSREALE